MKRILLLFFALSTLSIGQAQRHFDIQIWNDGEGVCQDSDANVPQMLCYLADNPKTAAIVEPIFLTATTKQRFVTTVHTKPRTKRLTASDVVEIN